MLEKLSYRINIMTSKALPTSIDRDKIPIPQPTFTSAALQELGIMLENDFTLKGKAFRLQISGKECDGFTYSCGFTEISLEDLTTTIAVGSNILTVVFDPFTAFYFQTGEIDFIMEPEKNREGFVITNYNQTNYSGKFWRKDENKIPPLL